LAPAQSQAVARPAQQGSAAAGWAEEGREAQPAAQQERQQESSAPRLWVPLLILMPLLLHRCLRAGWLKHDVASLLAC
jgi:hypothetical protein